jgi:hypothetical protein
MITLGINRIVWNMDFLLNGSDADKFAWYLNYRSRVYDSLTCSEL